MKKLINKEGTQSADDTINVDNIASFHSDLVPRTNAG